MCAWDLQISNRFFDSPCQRRIRVALEWDGRSKTDLDPTRMRPLGIARKHSIESSQSNWYHLTLQTRGNHANAGKESSNLPGHCPFAFWENQDRPAFVYQFAHIPDRFARARLGLRDRESIEEERDKPI